MIDIIKSLSHWLPGLIIGNLLYLLGKMILTKMEKHNEKKHSDFQKKYFPEEKE